MNRADLALAHHYCRICESLTNVLEISLTDFAQAQTKFARISKLVLTITLRVFVFASNDEKFSGHGIHGYREMNRGEFASTTRTPLTAAIVFVSHLEGCRNWMRRFDFAHDRFRRFRADQICSTISKLVLTITLRVPQTVKI